MKDFIVYAPPLDTKSAGNFMLHFLNSSLNDVGFKSRVVNFGNNISVDDAHKAIIIYPEIIHNNPLGAKNIAYYMLNKDGLLWGKKIKRDPRDFIFTYHRHFEANAPLAYFPLADLESLNFSDDISKRDLSLLYIGKGPEIKIDLDGKSPYLMITRKWPHEKDVLIEFLKNCRHFNSWDCMSSILMEAMLCGAAPIIHHWDSAFNKDEVLAGEMPEIYEMQQERNYSAENVLRKSERMRKKIYFYQKNWHSTLVNLAETMQKKFAY
jgi:hypothetical protein